MRHSTTTVPSFRPIDHSGHSRLSSRKLHTAERSSQSQRNLYPRKQEDEGEDVEPRVTKESDSATTDKIAHGSQFHKNDGDDGSVDDDGSDGGHRRADGNHSTDEKKFRFDAFIGREDELERLNSIYERMCRKPSKASEQDGVSNRVAQVVLIHGYSGTGKSALVDRFLDGLNEDEDEHAASRKDGSAHMKGTATDSCCGQQGGATATKKRRRQAPPCHFGKGKYDQYNAGGNLSGIADALSNFFGRISASEDVGEYQRVMTMIRRRVDAKRLELLCKAIPELSSLFVQDNEGSMDATERWLQNQSMDGMMENGADARSIARKGSFADMSMRSASTFDDVLATSTGPRDREWAQLVYAIKKILHAICSVSRPLVIYLDDLQWIDDRSLTLITEILLDRSIRNFLIIGSYRSNEVHSDPHHRLTNAISQWNESGKIIHDIPLDDLTLAQTIELLTASLDLDTFTASPLARILYDKTKGNVFYTKQALEGLHRRKLLTLNLHGLNWEWDEQLVADEIDLARNVVDIITSKLRSLPKDLQTCLRMASFLRSTFRQPVLQALIDRERQWQHQETEGREREQGQDADAGMMPSTLGLSLDSILDLAVKEEFLERVGGDRGGAGGQGTRAHRHSWGETNSKILGLSTGNPSNGVSANAVDTQSKNADARTNDATFRFVHDRIQQAAFLLTPPGDDLDRMKSRIGKHLMDIASDPALGEDWMWFVAADHLQEASSTAESNNIAPLNLVKLNLKVGQLAIGVAAFVPAANYLNQALAILYTEVAHPWDSQREICMGVHRALSEVELILGNYDRGSMLCQTILDHRADSIEDIVHINSSLAVALARSQRFSEALDLYLQSLKLLGTFPMRNYVFMIMRDFMKLKKFFSKHTDEEVLNLPAMTNPRIIMTMQILQSVGTVAFFANKPAPLLLAGFRQARLMTKYGLSGEGAYGLFFTATMAMHILKDFKFANRAKPLSQQLIEQTDSTNIKSKFFMTSTGFLTAWAEPVHVCLENYRRGQLAGMETGDLESAYRCWGMSLMHSFLCGLPLASLYSACGIFMAQVAHYNIITLSDTYTYVQDMLEYLLGVSSAQARGGETQHQPKQHWKDKFDMPLAADVQSSQRSRWAVCYWTRIQLATYLGELEVGKDYIPSLKAISSHDHSYANKSVRLFHAGLIMSRLAKKTADKRKRRQYRRNSTRSADELRATIKTHGGNNLHRCLMMQADISATSKKESEQTIRAGYDKAISCCARIGHIHDAALANELAAEYFLMKRSQSSACTIGPSATDHGRTSSRSRAKGRGHTSARNLNASASYGSQRETSLNDDDPNIYWIRQYLGNALALYNEWGARGKVEQLLEKYPDYVNSSMVDDSSDVDGREGGDRGRKRKTARHTTDTRTCVATAHKIMAKINLDDL